MQNQIYVAKYSQVIPSGLTTQKTHEDKILSRDYQKAFPDTFVYLPVNHPVLMLGPLCSRWRKTPRTHNEVQQVGVETHSKAIVSLNLVTKKNLWSIYKKGLSLSLSLSL